MFKMTYLSTLMYMYMYQSVVIILFGFYCIAGIFGQAIKNVCKFYFYQLISPTRIQPAKVFH